MTKTHKKGAENGLRFIKFAYKHNPETADYYVNLYLKMQLSLRKINQQIFEELSTASKKMAKKCKTLSQ